MKGGTSMKWDAFEDKICCLVFLKNHTFRDLDISESVQEARSIGVDKTQGSIKMKFSNIAAICDEYGIRVSRRIKKLDHYSIQNYNEFIKVKDYSLEKIIKELDDLKSRLG
jgi:hypothetical protein